MKISEILKRRKIIFSCEFFPPKTDEGMEQLYQTVRELKSLAPGYVSVTYGAGGGTRDKTIEIVRNIKQVIGIESMAHLTCVGHSKSEIKEILARLEAAGIENVIALRGDPPKGELTFKPHPDGFLHAADLAAYIRSGHDFCIAVAGYPEGHIESKDRETDWDHLRKKVATGADIIITQLFFGNDDFYAFEKAMRKRGVQVPIIPGLMPITNFSQIVKFTQMCGAKIPPELFARLEKVQADPDAVTEIGIDHATRQAEDLIRNGAPGIHFYTLNRSRSTKQIIKNLESKFKEAKP